MTARQAFNKKLTLLDEFEDVRTDPVHTELLLADSNLEPILRILAEEFVARPDFDPVLRRDPSRLRDYLESVAGDAARADGSNASLPDAQWQKSRRRKIRRKKYAAEIGSPRGDADEEQFSGDDEEEDGVAEDDDEEESAEAAAEALRLDGLREELCGEFVRNVVRVVGETVLRLRNMFSHSGLGGGGGALSEHARAEIDRLKAAAAKKDASLEAMAKRSEQAAERVMQMRDEIGELKAATHGMNYEAIEALLQRVAALERENEYLYARVVGQEAVQGKVRTSRLAARADTSAVLASYASKIRTQQKYIERVEKSAMAALDRDGGGRGGGAAAAGRTGGPREMQEMLKRALGSDDEAAKRMALLLRASRSGGDGTLEEDEDDVALFGFDPLPALDANLSDADRAKAANAIESMRIARREMRYQIIEQNNAEIVSRLVEPTNDHFFNVTEMVAGLQDLAAAMPENPKKRLLSNQLEAFKKKCGVERDALISAIRMTCNGSKETMAKFALLMRRKRQLRNSEVDEAAADEEGEELQKQLAVAAQRKKDRERQQKVDRARLASVARGTPPAENGEENSESDGDVEEKEAPRPAIDVKAAQQLNPSLRPAPRAAATPSSVPSHGEIGPSSPTPPPRSGGGGAPSPAPGGATPSPFSSPRSAVAAPGSVAISVTASPIDRHVGGTAASSSSALSRSPASTIGRPTPKAKFDDVAAAADVAFAMLDGTADGGEGDREGDEGEELDNFFLHAGFAEPVLDTAPPTAHDDAARKRRRARKSRPRRQPPHDDTDSAKKQNAKNVVGDVHSAAIDSSSVCPLCAGSLRCVVCSWHSSSGVVSAATAKASRQSHLAKSRLATAETERDDDALEMNQVRELVKVAITAGAAQREIQQRRAKENFRALAATNAIEAKVRRATAAAIPDDDRRNFPRTPYSPPVFASGIDAMLDRAARIKQHWEQKRRLLAAQSAAVADFFYNRLQFALYGSTRRVRVTMPSLEQLLSYAERVARERQILDSRPTPRLLAPERVDAKLEPPSKLSDAAAPAQSTTPRENFPASLCIPPRLIPAGDVLFAGTLPAAALVPPAPEVKKAGGSAAAGAELRPAGNGSRAARYRSPIPLGESGLGSDHRLSTVATSPHHHANHIASDRTSVQTAIRHDVERLYRLRQRADEDAILRNIEEQRRLSEAQELQRRREREPPRPIVNVFASSNTPLPQLHGHAKRKVKSTLSLRTRDHVAQSVGFALETEAFHIDGVRANSSMF